MLKHYRPFRCIRICLLGRYIPFILLVGAICIGTASFPALAQPSAAVGAPITYEEAHRRGTEAFNRRDYAEALQWYRKSADQGDPRGQIVVGQFFSYGWGMPRNDTQALIWYRKAADQGDAEGADSVGRLYHTGSGVPRDNQEAMKWFRKAADQGYAPSQAAVCSMYVAGEGVQADFEEGVAWCKKAAGQGNAFAQRVLGVGYLNGEGVPKDTGKAAVWLRKAAEQGDAESQTRLGNLYERGEGVPQDREQARMWFKKAIAQNHDKARKELAEMDAEDRNPGFKHPERIPPQLQTICFLDNPQMLKIKRVDKAEQEVIAQRYIACLRSNWKRINGSAPFPGD